jgi:hypothetical protein
LQLGWIREGSGGEEAAEAVGGKVGKAGVGCAAGGILGFEIDYAIYVADFGATRPFSIINFVVLFLMKYINICNILSTPEGCKASSLSCF